MPRDHNEALTPEERAKRIEEYLHVCDLYVSACRKVAQKLSDPTLPLAAAGHVDSLATLLRDEMKRYARREQEHQERKQRIGQLEKLIEARGLAVVTDHAEEIGKAREETWDACAEATKNYFVMSIDPTVPEHLKETNPHRRTPSSTPPPE